MPPTNIEASPCTVRIGEPGGNHRGPGVPWIRSRLASPSGPATRRNREVPARSRTDERGLTSPSCGRQARARTCSTPRLASWSARSLPGSPA